MLQSGKFCTQRREVLALPQALGPFSQLSRSIQQNWPPPFVADPFGMARSQK